MVQIKQISPLSFLLLFFSLCLGPQLLGSGPQAWTWRWRDFGPWWYTVWCGRWQRQGKFNCFQPCKKKKSFFIFYFVNLFAIVQSFGLTSHSCLTFLRLPFVSELWVMCMKDWHYYSGFTAMCFWLHLFASMLKNGRSQSRKKNKKKKLLNKTMFLNLIIWTCWQFPIGRRFNGTVLPPCFDVIFEENVGTVYVSTHPHIHRLTPSFPWERGRPHLSYQLYGFNLGPLDELCSIFTSLKGK